MHIDITSQNLADLLCALQDGIDSREEENRQLVRLQEDCDIVESNKELIDRYEGLMVSLGC